MIRQQHHRFRAETKLRLFEHGEGCVCEEGMQAESGSMPCEAEGGAGLVYLQSNEAHLRLECFAGDALLEDAGPLMHSERSLCPAGNCKERKAARLGIRLMRCCNGAEQVLAYRNDICNREHEVIVGIQVNGLTAAFEWSVGETWNRLAENRGKNG